MEEFSKTYSWSQLRADSDRSLKRFRAKVSKAIEKAYRKEFGISISCLLAATGVIILSVNGMA